MLPKPLPVGPVTDELHQLALTPVEQDAHAREMREEVNQIEKEKKVEELLVEVEKDLQELEEKEKLEEEEEKKRKPTPQPKVRFVRTKWGGYCERLRQQGERSPSAGREVS